MTGKKIIVVAGEASGDHHGAKVVKAMKQKDKKLVFYGIGGDELRDAGVEIIFNASELSVVGITEVFFKINKILTAMSTAKQALKKLKPDLLLLIDYPDFNLCLAGYAKKLSIPVLYYISPTIWAWRSGRIKTVKKNVDHMAVILPFEQHYYQKHKFPCSFVGHPLLDNQFQLQNHDFEKRFFKDPVIGLLPGSRDGEIEKLLPVMLKSAHIISQHIDNIKFLVSLSGSVNKNHVENICNQYRNINFELVSGSVNKIFEKCSFVIAASGTVTLEAAIAGIPMVVIYKVSPLSYLIGKILIKVNHISLANLILEKALVPELIQDQASPENISKLVIKLLENIPELINMREQLLKIRQLMGGQGASQRVAEIAFSMVSIK